jgi:hypothetical protein
LVRFGLFVFGLLGALFCPFGAFPFWFLVVSFWGFFWAFFFFFLGAFFVLVFVVLFSP